MSPKGDPQGEDFLDFELEIGAGSGRIYPVAVVRSAAGEAREMMQFPLDDLALENQLLTLQNALLRSGGKPRHILMPEEQSVQDFGQTLFNTLFTGAIGNCYAVSRREATLQGKGLRVKLRILSAEMAAIPWEFLYDPGRAEYVCLSRNTPVVRYLELPQPPQPLPVTLPLRILVMIATPTNLPPLDVKREQERMEKALEPLQQRGLVQLTWLTGQTWRDVQQAMRGGPWHIFHFIGHGSFDPLSDEGLIAFADDQGQADLFRATQLARLLADHRSLRLVVLNACESAKGGRHDVFSSAAANLVRHGIPAVLAMQYTITDAAAIVFSRAFYEALADGMPIDAAVSEARKAVSFDVENTLEWGIPVLFMRSPDGVLFTISQGPTPAQPSPPVIPIHKAPVTKLSSQLPKEEALELEPRSASGRGSTAYTVTLHNGGNTLAQYELSGEDDEKKLAYRFGQTSVALEPDREARVLLEVSTRRRWMGREQRHPFQIHARPAGGNPLTAQGEFVNKALIPGWLLLVVSFVLVAGIVWAFIPRPPLAAPQQVSPASGTAFTHFPRTTTLSWKAVSGAASYTVQIYYYQSGNTTCSGGTPYPPVAGITGTSYTFNFIGDQPGCWQVWAVDSSGRQGTKSPLWEFSYKTAPTQLAAPQQVSPASGTAFTHFPRTTTLSWKAVSGAASYTVQIYYYQSGNTTCSGGTPYPPVTGITGTSYTFNFIGDQPGCWQVWAVDSSGRQGTKSPLWEFSYKTAPTQLAAPQQVSPASGTAFTHFPRTTTLSWKAVSGAASYTVQIYYYQSGNTTCSGGTPYPPVTSITGTSYTFNFIGDQPGCWQVWAVDSSGRQGTKSPLWEFSYKTAPQPVAQYDGNWVNNDPNTSGITKLVITHVNQTITVHGYGRCYPTDCDWNTRSGEFTGSPFVILFDFGGGLTHQLTMSVNADGTQLQVVDVGSRSGTNTYFFHKG